MILGDFNLPSLSWSFDDLFMDANRDTVFLDCFIAASLTQWVKEPTFVSSGNILDLFLTSETYRVGRVEVLALFSRCLHCPVLLEYLFSVDIGAEQSVGKHILVA